MIEESTNPTPPKTAKDPENPKNAKMTRREALQVRLLQVQKKIAQEDARASQRVRKIDTQRKVILGGAVLAVMAKGDTLSRDSILTYIRDHSSERQREAVKDLLKAYF